MNFEEILEMEKEKERFPAIAKEVNGEKEVTQYKAPAISRGFDTRAVIANLKAMEVNCMRLISEANALEIETAEEKMDAANLSGGLQELAKKVKKQCEDFLEPHKKVSTVINGIKKRIVDAATTAKNIVNQKIFQYKKQEEINRAKQQQIINDQAQRLQKKLKAQARELKIEAPRVAPIKAPKPVAVIRGDTGASIYTRKGWKVAIITPEDVDRKYCLPAIKLLNQAVKMGVRKIAGCRVYQDETPVTRTG